MMNRGIRIWAIVLVALVLATGALGPVAVRGAQPDATGEPVMVRLKYATFDPLQGEPQIDSALRADAYPSTGGGAYIVQFKGPVQGAWKDRVGALGGRLMGYLPDYAFLVWMDGAVRERVAALDIVRWVGLYQPAYKLSPNLDRTRSLYRVLLFEGADLATVEERLAELNTPTREVPGELFTLVLPEGGVDQVATWPEVLWIENRPVYRLHNDVATGIMGANVAWDSGYTGAGQIVTVADTGIDNGVDNSNMHPDFRGRFDAIYDWYDSVTTGACGGCDCTIILDEAQDLDGHGTHVLGSVLGNGTASGGAIKGTAYEAIPAFQAVGQYVDYDPHCNPEVYPDGVQLLGLPDDLGQLFLEAFSGGSYIHSDSWGSRVYGEYTLDSQTVDQFVWDHKDMLILFSAGNMGTDKKSPLGYVDEDSLDAPGTAKNALTVGASDNERATGGLNPCSLYTWGTVWDFPAVPTSTDCISDEREELAAFSSRGPTDDGRIKPDVVAPGTNIVSARSSAALGTGWGLYLPDPLDYMYMGGTSMATPLTAGAAALVREYYSEAYDYTDPSAALVKATLVNSAIDITGYGSTSQEAGKPIPNVHEGWGRVDVGAATSGDRRFEDDEAIDAVGTGDTRSYTYDVNSSSKPFKVTLVWSDYPAEPPADPALVNDLNLVVTGPGGSPTYYGNDFDEINGWSLPGGSADSINNVESVYIQGPEVGTWTVRVTGANVAEPGGSPQQPFALVATGWFGPPPPPPVADFTGSPTSGEAPLEVSFADASTGMITGWAWDFGDGGTSTLQNPSHIYADVGDYTVSLTAIGPDVSDTVTKIDYIHVTPPALLEVDHASGAPGSYFVFTGQNFTPSVDATISVNGTDLAPTVPTDAEGAVEFALYTENLSPGWYFVSVRTNPSASTYFQLDPDGTLWDDPGVTPIIAVPGTIGPPEGVYLPLVMRTYPAPDPIVNGDFEDGPWQGWIEKSQYPDIPVVVDDVYAGLTPHSESWLAWLGGLEDESAYIEQTVTVPSGRSYLHFWHWISSSNINCATEQAVILVNGSAVRTYALCSSNRTWGWVEQWVDLGSSAGQAASLQFQATTAQDASSWYIDDVSFQISAATADAGVPASLDPGIPITRKVKPAPDLQP